MSGDYQWAATKLLDKACQKLQGIQNFVEKAPCTDLHSDPTLHPKFLQNYAGRRVRQPRTPNTSAARVVANLIKLKHCCVKKTVSPSTPTCWRRTPSFRSRRNTISHRETQTQQTNKTNQRTKEETRIRVRVPSVGLSYVKLSDTAASVH